MHLYAIMPLFNRAYGDVLAHLLASRGRHASGVTSELGLNMTTGVVIDVAIVGP